MYSTKVDEESTASFMFKLMRSVGQNGQMPLATKINH